jgi:GDP-4-dehydro-6-deoxy-D-mannose reductase
MRPIDVPDMRGDLGLLRQTTGWQPSIPLDQTLADVLAYWLNVAPATDS